MRKINDLISCIMVALFVAFPMTAIADSNENELEDEAENIDRVIAILPGEFGQLSVGINTAEKKVYIPLRQSGGINVVNAKKNALIRTIPPQPNVVEALDADANPKTNRVWVTTCESKLNPRICQRILILDGRTDNVLATITGQEFDSIRFNPETNRVYTANGQGSNITVLDANTNSVLATVPVGLHPRDIAVNSKTNRIYVTAENGNVSVIDGVNNGVIAVIQVGDARGVAVNPVTNRVYVSNGPLNTVTVVNGSTNAVLLTIPVGAFPQGIGVNPETNRIYAANTNGNDVSVVSGNSNTVVATVAIGQSPAGVRVDSKRNRIYVANYQPGTVSVIQGAEEEDEHDD